MKHIVYGNGESRPKDKIIGGEWVTTWGCNAIYRDFTVDNLVSVDYGVQQEIYESGYALKNKCWFSDWSVLPDFDTSMMLVGNTDPVYETKQFDRNSCVVQGKTIDSVQRVMDEILAFNPQLDKDDLRKKLEKDIGLYITWVADNDMVEDIDYPRGWSAGNTALYLACKSGAEEVYMCGFDGSNYSEPLNNIYKGSKNYLAADSRGFNTTNWDNQFKLVQKEFSDVQFYKVGTDLTYEELYNNIR
jgi:hypothetical protein